MTTLVYAKKPAARLDYGFDWTAWLDGATLATSTWVASDASLTINGQAIVGNVTSAFASGGIAGHADEVRNTVTDNGGRSSSRTLTVHVTTGEGLAPWTTPEMVREVVPNVPATQDVSLAVAFASRILWRLSGRQYGLRWRTIRPMRRRCGVCAGWPASLAWWYDHSGFQTVTPWSLPSGWERFVCESRCDRDAGVRLPGRPYALSSVIIDGVALAPSTYALDGARRLVRTDGGSFPRSNDPDLVLGSVGTWSVTYLSGRPVPDDGGVAAAELAGHIALAWVGSSACKLPARLTQVTRQDVTMAFQDPMDFLRQGRTGLYLPDLWLQSVNPRGLMRSATIARADDPRRC